MKTRAASKSSITSTRSNERGNKVVTGDTNARKVTIFTKQDEGESIMSSDESNMSSDENDVNLVHEYKNSESHSDMNCIFTISEDTIDRLYQGMQSNQDVTMQLYTTELMSQPFTPTTIKQALTCKDRELWRKSAIAEVNNFLKRKSWKFISKSVAYAQGRKLIGVKWVFKVKNEADYALRYKSRVVSSGYMQIPGIDYNEKFSPVAQASSVRVVLAMVLYFYWECELVDIEAAFLEGRLKQKHTLNFHQD